MENKSVFYICPVCFAVCDSEKECHAHRTLECNAGEPGSEKRKPVKDQFGNYVSRAPRWFLEASGKLEDE